MNVCHRVNILGVGISPVDMGMACDTIEAWILDRGSSYVCVTPVHSVMDCQRDSELRRIQNSSGMATPDGMPIVWICRLRGYQQVSRVYGPDLMLALCRRSVDKGFTHFLYGGAEGVPEQLSQNLQRRFPGLKISGTLSPPFRPLTPEEGAAMTQRINDANPDIVWVGLGSPKQERWMAEHRSKLTAPVLIGVGAAFDFHAGIKKQAPYWMQRAGLEWSFRLVTEPKRLWRRYLRDNPSFLFLIALQSLGLRRYPLDDV